VLKVLIVGCGRIAGGINQTLNTHGGAYKARKGVSIVACIDSNQEQSKSFADFFNCQVENNLETAIHNHKPDIISVCTPDNSHFTITERLIQAKHKPKVIFLEKPACSREEELDYLIELSMQKGVDIVVNHSRRFDEHYQQLRERITASEFGDLRSIYATYYSGWRHNGIHMIDTLSYLFNDSVNVDIVTNSWESPYENDPTIEMLGSFKEQDGIINLTGFDEEDYQFFEIDLRFNKARLRFENFGERIILETKFINQIGENALQLVENGLNERKETSMQKAIDIICQSIESNNRFLLDGYLLQDVTESMKTIWRSKKEYEKYRSK